MSLLQRKSSTSLLLLLLVVDVCHRQVNGEADDEDIEDISGQLQVDFMSHLYTELTASSSVPTELSNQTVVTVKSTAVSGAASCKKPKKPTIDDVVFIDFRNLVFSKRNFVAVNKVAIYVVDRRLAGDGANINVSSFTVTVDASAEANNKFRMSASVAVGGKSVFLLPNSTGAVCVYFPNKRRASLGIFGVIWGKEDASAKDDNLETVERAILNSLPIRRHRRNAQHHHKSHWNATFNLKNGHLLEAGDYEADQSSAVTAESPHKKLDHPRFFLKERRLKSGKKSVGGHKKRKQPKRGGKYSKQKASNKVGVNRSDKVKEFAPFGFDSGSNKNNASVGFERRKRPSSSTNKNERRRRRRQNHNHQHRHSLKIATAEPPSFFTTPESTTITSQPFFDNVNGLLIDDPTVDDQSCQRHTLPVKLSELGWKRVIIAPEVVDIAYCAGVCSAAKTPSKMSNQAMLLQLYKVVRGTTLPKSLPDPQCVPNSYSSLTLLFYDENENIVLKNYPNMVATSCGCR